MYIGLYTLYKDDSSEHIRIRKVGGADNTYKEREGLELAQYKLN